MRSWRYDESMPRQARLDAPGTVHHILARGVAKGVIVRDDVERRAIVKDLAELVEQSGASCLAWCLMSTHLHLVLRTGKRPLTWVMHRLLLRHAQRVNARWHRSGHVFQNRYKSLLVDEDTYLLALIRYVHRNPLGSGVVPSLPALARYPWSGHAALLEAQSSPWQATKEVLELFHRHPVTARKAYLAWMSESEPGDLERAIEGRDLAVRLQDELKQSSSESEREARRRDERILGEGEFVAEMLRDLERRDQRRRRTVDRFSPGDVLRRAAKTTGISEERLLSRDRRRPVSEARAVASSWLVDELGMRVSETASLLRVSPPAVSVAVERGRRLIAARHLRLERVT